VDDTLRALTEAFEREGFRNFARMSERLKIVHRCLDGIGLNYTRGKIISIKAYCKILDSAPKFSDEFLNTFGAGDGFRSALLDLCSRASPCILNRKTGLSGVNIGIKYNPETKESTKSVYVKTSPNISYVLNCGDVELRQQKYRYVFNGAYQRLLNLWFGFGIPSHNHALEFSRRATGSFATVYPIFPRKPNQRPSSMREQYGNFFKQLNSSKEWGIENKIIKSCAANFPLWTPITKGYEAKGKSRKIYMGRFSYKNSCFDYFKH
jgi:hypothetical protein